MAPVAIHPPPGSTISISVQAKGPALVIGSLSTARDGKYQRVVSELEATREVERQMLDRLLDRATILAPDSYASIHITLSQDDHQTLQPRLSELLSLLREGLSPLGTLHLIDLTSGFPSLSSDLILAGFQVLTVNHQPEDTIIAQKPAGAAGASMSLKAKAGAALASVALPRRSVAAKKAIWDLTPARGDTIIDAESLLTDADRVRPAACEPASAKAGGPRRRKACKGCTCGLAEEEEEAEEAELRNGLAKVVLLDGSESGGATEVALSEKERLARAAKAAPKATSSCGNCFLGDAFRCAGCPYMGLPAFKPGEKVEIDLGMDDV